MKYSFITTVRNRQERLDGCLHSILWQQFRDYEVIVVDYGSESPVQVPQGVKLIRWEADIWNESIAKNIGIANASGEQLFLLNCDSIIAPDLLGIIDSLLGKDSRQHIYWRRFDLSPEGLSVIQALEWKQIEDCFETSISSKWIQQGWGEWHPLSAYGDLLVVRKVPVMQLGGFDERMLGWGYLDVDLRSRLSAFGYQVHWETEFKLIHCYHKTLHDGQSCRKNEAIGNKDTKAGKIVRNGGIDNFLQYNVLGEEECRQIVS